MMVYLLYDCSDYYENVVWGIYSSKERAEDAIPGLLAEERILESEVEIEEWEVDE
jgi:hypothetical protein